MTWYESKQADLGRELLDEVDATFAAILEMPEKYPIAYAGLRRAVLHRFPYVVYFLSAPDVVTIFAVLHGRRDRSSARQRSESET